MIEFDNKIICADSLQILKQLQNNSIDIVLTSPPYNFEKEYSNYEDNIDWNNYFDRLNEYFIEFKRILKSGGRAIIDVQPNYRDNIPTHHKITQQMIDLGFIWKGEIIWNKNNYNCPYTTWGSWQSPSAPYLKYQFEFVEVFCKDNLKKDGLKENIDITSDEFKMWTTATWNIAPENRMSQFGHPAMFPEELVIRCLKLFSYKNDIILDPFNGCGTTTFIAHKLDRRYIGIDISSDYCYVAEKRIKELDKIKRLF